jgi:hypothetical protein
MASVVAAAVDDRLYRCEVRFEILEKDLRKVGLQLIQVAVESLHFG